MIVVEGFGQHVVGAQLDRFDAHLQRRVRREHEDHRVRRDVLDRPDDFHSAKTAWHFQVRDDHIKDVRSDTLEGLLGVSSRRHTVTIPSKNGAQDLAHAPLIVHDEDPGRHCHHHRISCAPVPVIGSVNFTHVPSPSTLSTSTLPLCSSMIRWTNESPRPVPPSLVVKNG